jgi:two-component system, NarL family, sensor histidine kinase UhpB
MDGRNGNPAAQLLRQTEKFALIQKTQALGNAADGVSVITSEAPATFNRNREESLGSGGRALSLRFRLITSIGFGMIASVTVGSAVALWEAAHQTHTEMHSAIKGAEHVVRTALDDTNHDLPPYERLQHLIADFDGSRHVQATVIDRKHQVALASTLEPPDTRVPDWFRRLLDSDPEVSRVPLPSGFDEYAAIVLTTDATNEVAEKWGDIGLALGLLIAFCAFVLGLVYWILEQGLRPLQALNAAFDCVGRGDYRPRVPEGGATELAHLARDFNQMVTRLRTMQLQNARLNEQLANVQEEDRAELARELHDEIGPFLFAVGLDIATINQAVSADAGISAQLAPRLEAIRTAIAHMQKHLKIILGRLRPAVLLDLGLAQALDNSVDFWKGRHPNVVFDLKMAPENFSERLDEGIYRIVRESLSNALRHGHPSEIDISIQLGADDNVEIDVIDDGGGLMPTTSAAGFGITGMQERAALLGGTVSVQNRDDGKGVVVRARLPLQSHQNLRQPESTFST